MEIINVSRDLTVEPHRGAADIRSKSLNRVMPILKEEIIPLIAALQKIAEESGLTEKGGK